MTLNLEIGFKDFFQMAQKVLVAPSCANLLLVFPSWLHCAKTYIDDACLRNDIDSSLYIQNPQAVLYE